MVCTLFQYTMMGENQMLFNDFRKSFDYGSHIEVTFNDGETMVGVVIDIDAETETSDAEISLSLDDGGYINFNISDISSAISA